METIPSELKTLKRIQRQIRLVNSVSNVTWFLSLGAGAAFIMANGRYQNLWMYPVVFVYYLTVTRLFNEINHALAKWFERKIPTPAPSDKDADESFPKKHKHILSFESRDPLVLAIVISELSKQGCKLISRPRRTFPLFGKFKVTFIKETDTPDEDPLVSREGFELQSQSSTMKKP